LKNYDWRDKVKAPISKIILLLLLTLILTCCTGDIDWPGGPQGAAKALINGIFSGDPDSALDQVCIGEGGVIWLISVMADWGEDNYEILYKSENSAQVNVTGRVRINFRDLERYLEELEGLESIDPAFETPVVDLPTTGVGIQVNVNFDEMYLAKERGSWCAEEQSIYEFYKYLVNLFINELESL